MREVYESRNPPGSPPLGTERAFKIQTQRIIDILDRHDDGLTRNEISALTEIAINAVTARVKELLDQGALVIRGRRRSAISKFHNEVVGLPPRPRHDNANTTLDAWVKT